nr:MAG TPA: hypothetical protein [Caudoviricetes sp.]
MRFSEMHRCAIDAFYQCIDALAPIDFDHSVLYRKLFYQVVYDYHRDV